MKIKVCGMREPENILAITQQPIDFIGFIFYKESKRLADDKSLIPWLEENTEQLKDISRVGVFVNAEIDFVLNKVHDYQLDFVQLHGFESPEYCREIQSYWDISTMRKAKLIKAFSVDEGFDFTETRPYEHSCAMFLFDTKGPDFGGNGEQFNWDLLEEYRGTLPFMLSGGIGPDSADKIKSLDFPNLYGVDINSRFEIKPGLKDPEKVEQFVKNLKDDRS